MHCVLSGYEQRRIVAMSAFSSNHGKPTMMQFFLCLGVPYNVKDYCISGQLTNLTYIYLKLSTVLRWRFLPSLPLWGNVGLALAPWRPCWHCSTVRRVEYSIFIPRCHNTTFAPTLLRAVLLITSHARQESGFALRQGRYWRVISENI